MNEWLRTFYSASIMLLALLAVVACIDHHLKFFLDATIGIIVISLAYHYRHKFIFSLEGAVLCLTGWAMNAAGAINAYQLSFYGVGWDKLLHMTSCAGLVLLFYAYLTRKTQLAFWERAFFAIFVVAGFGALNEIVEFIGSQYFGIGQGLFGMSNGVTPLASVFERFDTQWDMIFNMIGSLLALGYIRFTRPVEHKHATAAKTKSPA